jgi:hypothetical protein
MKYANVRTIQVAGFAAIAGLVLTSTGCSNFSEMKPSKMFSLDNTWPFKDKDKPHEGKPVRMVCTWSDTVMTQPGIKPQRGFGGRIMFYESDDKKPILVDGQLVVYAFDENGRAPTDNKPTRRYVFPAEQIPLHMSKSELGASYSFWLPWDDAGGPRTEVGLICRFEPKGGAVVTSEQTKQRLPGTDPVIATNADGSPKPPKLPEGVSSKPAIESLQTMQKQRTEAQRATHQANYEVATAANGGVQDDGLLGSKKMSATTITLPNNFTMPSAATLMAQNPSLGSQAAPQSGLRVYPGQPALQQTPSAAAAAVQQTASLPAGLNRPAAIPQFTALAIGSNVGTAPTQLSVPSPAAFPTTQVAPTAQPGSPASQQAALQQLLQQQQALQQKLQQLQQSTPTGNTSTGNANATATNVSYPAGPAYLR